MYLVKKENFRTCDELACDAYAALLTTTNTLLNRCANQGIGLILEAECRDKSLNTLLAFRLANRAVIVLVSRARNARLYEANLGSDSWAAKYMVSWTVREPTRASSCST